MVVVVLVVMVVRCCVPCGGCSCLNGCGFKGNYVIVVVVRLVIVVIGMERILARGDGGVS